MKNKMFYRVIGATVGLALSATFTAPAFAADTQTHKPKVALVMKSLANEFFLTMENGAKEYQKKMPTSLI